MTPPPNAAIAAIAAADAVRVEAAFRAWMDGQMEDGESIYDYLTTHEFERWTAALRAADAADIPINGVTAWKLAAVMDRFEREAREARTKMDTLLTDIQRMKKAAEKLLPTPPAASAPGGE